LRPTKEAVRSKTFVDRVAAVAQVLRCPIELEGSLLAHTYYELARSGATVRAVDVLEPVEKRQSFGKLVRDLIPVRIESRGEEVRTHRASRDELLPLLKAKAIEEALELLAADDAAAQLEEVADVLEVLRAICAILGHDLEAALAVAETKRQDRGGFEDGVVLLETREPAVTEALGSFDQLFPASASAAMTDSLGRRRPTELYPRPRWIPNRLTLPLVPPERGRPRSMTVTLSVGSKLLIRYGEKEVVVELTSPDRDIGNPQQLQLALGS
jgi:predicted house-cleaning noncanonical NTP pyrophosphatase (MazG superfamily)